MDPSRDTSAGAARLCPTCGTRLAAGVTRCVVCGADLRPTGARAGARRRRSGFALAARGAGPVGGLRPPDRRDHLRRHAPDQRRSARHTDGHANADRDRDRHLRRPPSPARPSRPRRHSRRSTTRWSRSTPAPAWRFGLTSRSSPSSISTAFPSECLLSVGTVLKIPQPTPTPSPEPTVTLHGGRSDGAGLRSDCLHRPGERHPGRHRPELQRGAAGDQGFQPDAERHGVRRPGADDPPVPPAADARPDADRRPPRRPTRRPTCSCRATASTSR